MSRRVHRALFAATALLGCALGSATGSAQPAPSSARDTASAAHPNDDAAASATEADEEEPPIRAGDAAPPEALPPLPDPLAGRVVTSSRDRAADLVVVVSIDGLRADAVLPSHPTLDLLGRQGVRAERALTIRRSTTLASHASMLSGVDDDQHGLTWNSWRPHRGGIRFPTALRVAARAGLPAALFVTKPKLQHLLGPDADGVAFTLSRGGCAGVVRRAEPWLRDTAAGVAMLHFPEPDSAGHRRGWMSRAYRAAVVAADACLGDVVRAIRTRPRGTERVLLIVTADHGGHGRSHGTLREVDRRIPWLAWGGAARRGGRIDREIQTMDTAATVLAALGLPRLEGLRGEVVHEALRERGDPAAIAQAARRPAPTAHRRRARTERAQRAISAAREPGDAR